MFLDLLDQTVREKCRLKKEQSVLVGVSGGADSLAMLAGLDALGYPLVVAHLDHGIRAESTSEAEFVRELAESRGLRFESERMDVLRMAKENGQSLEEAAREARYGFLFARARETGAQAVAVAHNADDQVETVLMHLIRGAGLSGLSGMDFCRIMPVWDPDIPLVRPLLNIWREEIERYVAEAGLEPRFDLSNLDTTYFRNRLRHELIPELETYNPKFKEVLWRTANVLGEEDRFFDALAESAWKNCLIAQSDDSVELAYAKFLDLPKTMQQRVLRRAVAELRPDLRDMGFEAVQRGLAFIRAPGELKEIDFVARLNLAVLRESLVVKSWEADLPEWEYPLLPDGVDQAEMNPGESLRLRNGWRITAEYLDSVPDDPVRGASALSEDEVWLDADSLTLPLKVRGWQEGERWHPFGLGGHSQKISDFFVNRKVPAHLRANWPLVCSEGEVVWVVGLRPGEKARITPQTRKILKLNLQKLA